MSLSRVILDHDGGVDDLVALVLLAVGNYATATGAPQTPSAPTASPVELIGCIITDADCFAAHATPLCRRILNVIRAHAPGRHALAPSVPIAVSSMSGAADPFPPEWRKDCINIRDMPCLNTGLVDAADPDGAILDEASSCSGQSRPKRRHPMSREGVYIDTRKGEEVLADLVLNAPTAVTLVVTGPLSNVAWCVTKHGEGGRCHGWRAADEG